MIDIANCPSCRRALRVPDDLLGQQVKCPACGTIFTANAAGAPSAEEPAPPVRSREHEPQRRRGRSERVARPDEEDDYDRPRRYGEEGDPDRPRRRARRRRDEDEDKDDYEDDYEDRPRRRRYAEHRGSLILTLGVLSLFMLPLILGPIAWVMGTNDLHEMRAGRMDPEGESNTATGRTLGMVSTLLCLFCIAGVLGLVALGALSAL
jgi:predicted Zn finger-like uncharacterized protein